MIRAQIANAIAAGLSVNAGVAYDRPDGTLPFANVVIGQSDYLGDDGQYDLREYRINGNYVIQITDETAQSDKEPYNRIEGVIEQVEREFRLMKFADELLVVQRWVVGVSEVSASDEAECKTMEAAMAVMVQYRKAVYD